MPLQPGTTLGPFEVLRPIGAGGMGEVYEARDTRLGRSVAIKVLNPTLASDAEFRTRFTREARTLARIAHPSICVLHDVGDVDGTMYLVLEYVDGQTLADRLARGPLPMDEIVRIAVEICRALSAAHRAGIAHRDLKPGNVMLTKSGVKLLDFGLAKDVRAPHHSGDVTTAALLTREGTVMGTAPYMAPEQLEGREADARSDIFALGAVLFETATGRRAFAGTSAVSTSAAILAFDPPAPSTINPAVTPAFDAIVAGCLAKDPDERWQSAHDVARQLEGLRAVAHEPRLGARRVSWLPWTIAALAIAAALAAWRLPRQERPSAAGPVSFELRPPPGVMLSESVEGNQIALSPDGTELAWVGLRTDGSSIVYVRPLARLESQPIAGTEGATAIFWSPDSRTIAFFARPDGLKRIDVAGGGAVPICTVRPGVGYTGTWGPDGQILFAPIQGEAIYRVSSSGGVPEQVVVANRAAGEHRVSWPWFVGDGRSAVYSLRSDTGGKSLMLWRPGQPPSPVIGDVGSEAQYVDPGYLVFARSGSLLAQRFDPASGRLSGNAISISSQIEQFISSGWVSFTAARNGTVAFTTRETRSRLAWIDRSGRQLGYLGNPGNYLDLAYGPDDDTVLTSRTDPALGSSYDVWSIDVQRGTETRVTTSPETEVGPLMSPDRRSMFVSMVNAGTAPQIFRRDLGTGRDEPLVPTDAFQSAASITRDGKTLIYEQRTDRGNWDLWMTPLAGSRKPVPLLATDFVELGGRLSPDDRWLAFVSNETGDFELYLAPFPGLSPKSRISANGGSHPRWSPDGRELFFLDRAGMLQAAAISGEGRVGQVRPMLTQPPVRAWLDYLPIPDGQRFLVIAPESLAGEQPLTVVTHAVR